MGVVLPALALLAVPAAAPAKKKGKGKLGPVVTVTQTLAVAVNANPTVTATCPAGTRVVGGGYAATPFHTNGSNFVFESRRTGARAWTVRSHNAAPVAGSLVAEAYCRRGAPKLAEASSGATLPGATLGFPEAGTSATCPKGKSAFAGGFAAGIDETAVGYSGAFVIVSMRSAARVWSASAINTDNDPRPLTAYAYCAKGSAPAVTSPIVDVTGAGTPAAAATPACPRVKVKSKKKKKGTSAVAGGFVTAAPDVGWARAHRTASSRSSRAARARAGAPRATRSGSSPAPAASRRPPSAASPFRAPQPLKPTCWAGASVRTNWTSARSSETVPVAASRS